MDQSKKQTAVDIIEIGIKARERHWQTEYQQGYQRALSDIAMYIQEAKAMEKEQISKAWDDGNYAYFYSKETGVDFNNGEQYYKEFYGK